jgi:hypothetical protein
VIGDHVEHLLLGGSRQVGHWAVQGLLFHLANFFHRQLGLPA